MNPKKARLEVRPEDLALEDNSRLVEKDWQSNLQLIVVVTEKALLLVVKSVTHRRPTSTSETKT